MLTVPKYKEDKYQKMLVLLQGFVGNTVSYELKKQFFEEQYKSWLYCSDDVARNINRLIELLIKYKKKNVPEEEGKKAIGDIVLSMRRDILGNTKLTYEDIRYTDVYK